MPDINKMTDEQLQAYLDYGEMPEENDTGSNDTVETTTTSTETPSNLADQLTEEDPYTYFDTIQDLRRAEQSDDREEESSSSTYDDPAPSVGSSNTSTYTGPSIFTRAYNYFFTPVTQEVAVPEVAQEKKQDDVREDEVVEEATNSGKKELSAKEMADQLSQEDPYNFDAIFDLRMAQKNEEEQRCDLVDVPIVLEDLGEDEAPNFESASSLAQRLYQEDPYTYYDTVFDLANMPVVQEWQPNMHGAIGPQVLPTSVPLYNIQNSAQPLNVGTVPLSESEFLNALAKAPFMSAIVTGALQVPNVLMVNTMTHGHPTRPLPTGKGIVPVIGALSKGLGANIVTGQGRGLTSATAKQTKPGTPDGVEVMGPEMEVPYNPYMQILHTGFFSQADLIVGQTGNIGWLRTAKNCHVPWSIHNVKEVVAVGYPIRTVTSAATFGAMCYLPGVISTYVPIESEGKREVAANFFSGLVTAVISTPLNMVGDTMVKHSHVDPKTGQITRMTIPEYMSMAKGVIAEKGLKSVLIDQAPVARRMATIGGARLGIVFVTLDLAIKALPEKPLVSVVGMFGRNNPNMPPANDEPQSPSPEQEDSKRNQKGAA